MTGKANIVRVVSSLLGIAALAAVGWYTYQAFTAGLSFSDLRLQWLAAAFVLHLVVVSVLPVLWVPLLHMVRNSGDALPTVRDRRLVQAYGRSWLARYIPGRIWMFGGRVIYGKQAGISARATGASTVLEAGISYSALGLLGAALLAGAWIHWSVAMALAAGGLAVSFGAMMMLFRGRTLASGESKLAKTIRKASTFVTGDAEPAKTSIFLILLAYWAHAAAQLAFFIMVGLSVQDVPRSEYMLLAGAWGVGASIGYLSLFSAGGLGVRDGIALAFVGPALTGPIAATVVAVSRIILVTADLVFVGTVEIILLLAKGKAVPSPASKTDSSSTDVTAKELAIGEGS